jgi:two-component system, NtrC family, response regulator HydG
MMPPRSALEILFWGGPMATTALLITDDGACAKRLAEALAASGLEAKRCSTVRDGMSAIRQGSADLVFCQERLADGTFRDVLNFLFPRNRMPLIVCSNFYNTKVYIEAMSLGAFDYVAFPYSPQDLRWIIANALNKSSALSAAHRHSDAA